MRAFHPRPKRFAALVGLVFTVAVLSALLLKLHVLALALAGLLVGCAALEAFAGICVACLIYPYLRVLRRQAA